MPEPELRRRLDAREVDQVRQGTSDWHSAAQIRQRFEALDQTGVYIRDRRGTRGPFTAERAVEIVRDDPEVTVRIGKTGQWVAGERFVQAADRLKRRGERGATGDDQPASPSNDSDRASPHNASRSGSSQSGSSQGGSSQGGSSPVAGDGEAGKAIRVTCPGCQKLLQLRSAASAATLRCPQCQTQFRINVGPPATQPTSAHPQSARPQSTRPQPANRGPANLGPANAASAAAFDAGGLNFDLPPAPALPKAALPTPMMPTPMMPTPGASFAAPPAMSSNPYAAPASIGSASPMMGYSPGGPASGSVREVRYIVPGIIFALMAAFCVLGVLIYGLQLLALAAGAVPPPAPGEPPIAVLAGSAVGQMVLTIAFGCVYAAGAMGMFRRRANDLTATRIASVCTAIPCFGCVFFPIGIWACVSVFGQYARVDFRR